MNESRMRRLSPIRLGSFDRAMMKEGCLHRLTRKWLFVALVSAAVLVDRDAVATSSTAGATAEAVTLSERDNGRSISIKPSNKVRLVLHSTYWQIRGSSDPSVVAPEGEPMYDAKRADCVPGGGCGTVVQSFTAMGAGRVDLRAERKVCGEALACRPDQQRFAVTIVVE